MMLRAANQSETARTPRLSNFLHSISAFLFGQQRLEEADKWQPDAVVSFWNRFQIIQRKKKTLPIREHAWHFVILIQPYGKKHTSRSVCLAEKTIQTRILHNADIYRYLQRIICWIMHRFTGRGHVWCGAEGARPNGDEKGNFISAVFIKSLSWRVNNHTPNSGNV